MIWIASISAFFIGFVIGRIRKSKGTLYLVNNSMLLEPTMPFAKDKTVTFKVVAKNS